MTQKTLIYTFHYWGGGGGGGGCQGAFVWRSFVLDPDYSYINFHKSFPNNFKTIFGGGGGGGGDEINCSIF